ncbi:VCBS repeat-containing protein [Flavobacterium sp. SM15]|uniref:FG-GAP repeat domain-containing protein n=1 Tax=Flavobacterium sp. SM15 TaxID=2908005 RepID=UPI001EDC1832|nr:VCBS repeat-containing protein [Flavobacterium sp. SM15]MCG2611821.1 VCBS repeat-containing protein [Flavobacterium sp. SM15]
MKNLNRIIYHLYTFLFFLIYGVCSAQDLGQIETINGSGLSYKGIKTFDADGDGDLDIISFPYLYLNDGAGRKQKTIIIGNSKKEYEDYNIEDMDGDKDIDIVVLYKNGDIDILINEKNGFNKKPQKNKITYLPAEYAKLYLYDANSDGIRDIIISGLKGVPVAYIGDKKTQYTYFNAFNNSFNDFNTIFGLDLNKDRIQELLVYQNSYDQNNKAILNAYSFKENKYVKINSFVLPSKSISNIRLIDMDKDGDHDLVYSSGYSDVGIYWIERTNNGGLGKVNTLITQLEMEDYQIGDFDYDGDFDIAYFSLRSNNPFINWAKNNGNNTFIKNHKSLIPNIKESKSFIFEDFDGDKIKDAIYFYDNQGTIRPRYNMALQTKDGQLKELSTWIMSAQCAGFIMADIDTNGTKDIVGHLNNELFYILVDTKGNYSEAKELAISPFIINTLKYSDINNDGKNDLIVSTDDRDNGKLGWFKNEGNLKFNSFTSIHDDKDRLISFEVIDYDNNGTKDIAVNYWDNATRGFYFYNNLGNGIFSKDRIEVMVDKKSFPKLAIWDVNEDGILDIIDNKSSIWFKYLGLEKWEKQTSPFYGNFIKSIFNAKLDHDNKTDCIQLSTNNLKWLENDNNQWTGIDIPTENFEIEDLRVGDMNKDGYDDIVCYVSRYGLSEGFQEEITFSYKYSIIILENDKSGKFRPKPLFPISNISGIELHDIDNDGDLDIIYSVRHFPTAGINVWKNLN